MFKKIHETLFPPTSKPVMVWDGQCPFCKYWIIFWSRCTKDAIEYISFQQNADRFPDVPKSYFKEAVRFIEPDGKVFNGPDAAYKSMEYYAKPVSIFHLWYCKSRFFRKVSDYCYQFVTSHRSLLLKISLLFFGNDPTSIKAYWAWYIGVPVAILTVVLMW